MITYEEFDKAVDRAWNLFLDSLELDLSVSMENAITALDRKDCFNDVSDALISLVEFEEEE